MFTVETEDALVIEVCPALSVIYHAQNQARCSQSQVGILLFKAHSLVLKKSPPYLSALAVLF